MSYVHSRLGYGGGMPSETRAPRAAFLGVEQSLTGRRWAARLGDERAALAIAQRHGLPDAVSRLLAARDVDLEGVPDFLEPTLRKFLPDPSHLKDMDAAVARLVRAVRGGERIVVFGDYDVDGATSSALLLRFFRAVGGDIGVYIPDRRREGYGPNAPALLKLQQEGAAVVVTVDCGVTAFEPLAEAGRAGLDLIVIDHHQAEIALPEAIAVVDPNRIDDASPHKQMAAVGVAFLLTVGVNRALREAGWYSAARPEPDLRQWLDLVALGTVCDVVPLTGVNRALVRQGLLVMAQRRNAGLAALADVARLNETPGAYHLGFMLGPRVNAGGRVGQADLGAAVIAARQSGLLVNGGGHAMAAGLTVARSALPDLAKFLDERIAPQLGAAPAVRELGIDAALAPGAATQELVGMIERAGPFGAGNALPRFALTSVRVNYVQPVGEGHVRCTLVGAERGRVDAIAFRASQTALGPALLDPARPVLHVAGALRIDRYGGRETVRLQIDDAATAAGSVLR